MPAGTSGFGCPGCSLRLALVPESVTPLNAKRPLPPGLKSRFFGDYEILNELARGGMGVIYRARQLSLNRLVALKMVQAPHLLSDEARLRFRVEIEAVAQLDHPHIVALYESGEQDGAHFFTMRLVEGGDFGAQLKQERPLRQSIRTLVKVCRAVHYAHQRGILHRDLKPSNILVDAHGEPHVADFGLATPLDRDTGFTFTSSVLGSPNYMAPEQATGRTRQLTTAVDVYGLGAILYHILTGRPPFQAPTPIETLRLVVDTDPVPPRSLKPRVDADLETIALKCLRKGPGERYGSAEELALDLECWLEGRPIRARPIGWLATAWRWARRHPAPAVLGAALMLALLTIAVGTSLAAVRIRKADQQSASNLRESLLREAASLRLGGRLGHREETLSLIQKAAGLGGDPGFQVRVRDELLATLARVDLKFIPLQGSNFPPDFQLVGIHPWFTGFLGLEGEHRINLYAFTNAALLGRLQYTNRPITRFGGFSGNGMYQAMWQGERLSFYNLQGRGRTVLPAGSNAIYAFHPTEDSVLVQTNPNEAVWLDLPQGTERVRWSLPARRPAGREQGWHTLAFSPNGRMVVGSSGTSRVLEFLDPYDGHQLRIVTNSANAVSLAWSAKGGLLAVGTSDSRVLLWEPATGMLRWKSPVMLAPARSLAFHPRGDLLAVECADQRIRLFDVEHYREIYETEARARHLAFSPGGNRLGTVEMQGQWGYLEFQRPAEVVGFDAGSSEFRLNDVRLSAEGRVLATGHSDQVMLHDPSRGTRYLSKSSWRMSACAFHPSEPILLVTEPAGLVRYRYHFNEHSRLERSTPEIIDPQPRWRAFNFSADGRRFIANDPATNVTYVFDHTLTNRVATLGPHRDLTWVTLSPDGTWAATMSRAEADVRIWSVADGTIQLTLPFGAACRAVFSGDGRWLAVFSPSQFKLFECGSWKPGPSLPVYEEQMIGAAAFSADGGMMALVVNRFDVQLIDLERVESMGVLTPPEQVPIFDLAFSRDGAQLAAVGLEAKVVVWKLAEIRKRLADFGLAWQPANQAPKKL